MTFIILRIIVLFLMAAVGGQLASNSESSIFIGVLYGLVAGGIVIGIEYGVRKFSLRHFSSAIIGLVLGVVVAYLIQAILKALGDTFFTSDVETNQRIQLRY